MQRIVAIQVLAPTARLSNSEPPHDVTNRFSRRPQPAPRPVDSPLSDARFHRLVAHLHRLGVRPLGELLLQLVGTQDDARTGLVVLLEQYRQLDVDVVEAVGGNRWPETIFPVEPK